MSKSVVRSVKNVTKGYSSVQVKVRNATSNDAWGPSGSEMSEIAQMTFNNSSDFYEIMDMLDKRLNDKGKNWRHVLKSLKVLDYCLHEGSENVVTWARKNVYLVKTLREFQYIDEENRDVGLNVRTSAKELTSLILDEDRLRAERHDRKLWKARVTGLEDGAGPMSSYSSEPTKPRRNERERKPKNDDDDLEMKLALEASKNEAEEDKKRRERKASTVGDEDDDLAKAIKLSKEEEELRKKELEEANAKALFDDTPTQEAQPTGWNQGYQQQGAVDWYGNLMDQQQPQSTGYLNNAYAQPNQPTGMPYGYGYNQFQQPQPTAFDQLQYQQPQYMQPQQTAFNMNNPYSQPNNGFGMQNPQPQAQQQEALKPGSNNPWGSNNEMQDTLKPLQTGSNNPFASTFSKPPQPAVQRPPTLDTLQAQKTQTQFSQPFSAPLSFTAQPQPPPQKETDSYTSNLNALLATGDGQDTFGNVGNLRIPAQHTAPGTFINSAGTGVNRMQPTQTGSNPFMTNQFTGMPQTQPPMQTGPAYGSANPFGGSQRRDQGQSGSLIDL